jgi:thioredoxin reductase
MSCANACLSFGLQPVVIERGDHLGGAQRSNFHPNLWMLGFPEETGEQMTQRLADHYRELPVTTHYRAEVTQVQPAAHGFLLTLAGAGGIRTLEAAAIVLATGTRPRATAALRQFAATCPRAIIGPLSNTIRDGIRDTDVLILGGGDNALDHALFLAERGNRAVVCTRAAFSARRPFIAACQARGEIDLRAHCPSPRLACGDDRIMAAWPEQERAFDWLLVMYGYLPNTDVLEAFEPGIRPARTGNGYLHVDAWQRSSVPRIYAAGDVTDSPQPSVPTAMAQGLTAARAVERDLS